MTKYSTIIRYQKTLFLAASAMLLLSVLPLPYGYYTLLRLVVIVVSALGIFVFNEMKDGTTVIFLGLIFILFNPFIPIHLDKMVWVFIDIVVAIYFYFLFNKIGEKNG